MKHPLQKPLLYLLTSSCQKTPSFSDARESDLFRERSRLFELEFWNKKNSLTRADGGRWSSLYDDRYHSDESFWNTPLLRGALRLSRMRFVSFLKRFFSRVASRKLITVGVFFFSFLSRFSPISQKLLNFADDRHTLRAQKQKTDEEKDHQQKSYILAL
jgi:hypothetical protein